MDITEEPWFENERSGSLDHRTFDMVQRQLLDRPNYLLQRVLKSPQACASSQDPGPGSKPLSKQAGLEEEAVYSSAHSSGKYDPNLTVPFDLDLGDSWPNEGSGGKLGKTALAWSSLAGAGTASAFSKQQEEEEEEQGRSVFSTPAKGEAGQSQDASYTPPRREKHDADYLISAGLLVEADQDQDQEQDEEQKDDAAAALALPAVEEAAGSLGDFIIREHSRYAALSGPADAASLLLGGRLTGGDRQHSESSEVTSIERSSSSAWCTRIISSELSCQPAQQEEVKEGGTEGGTEAGEMSLEHVKLFNAASLIEWDLPRTFPSLAFFHDGGSMHTGLERILLCYALYKPTTGYVQGMSFLVATLLLCMDECEAFKCLANLLERRISTDFYGLRKRAVDAYVRCFDHFFKKLLPLLFHHLRQEGVTSEMFLMDWNLSLFTKVLCGTQRNRRMRGRMAGGWSNCELHARYLEI